jgi:hypothetical protein
VYNVQVRCLVLAAVSAGCSFPPGVLPPSDGGAIDAPLDAAIDAPPDAFDPNCFGKSPFTVCLATSPSAPITLPTAVNTSANGNNNCSSIGGATGMVSGVEVCVIAGTSITVSGTLVGVFGSRPLVLVATDTITVSTTSFDITSRSSGTPSDGPNANPPQCNSDATLDGANANMGGGGGAGGTFGSKGGNGGTGANGNSAAGIAKDPPSTFDVLRGGCPGGRGGAGNSTKSNGGSGGGALYMVARTAIDVTGTINASGGGGFGGEGPRGGGGGGGSGGMIVLHAPTLSLGAASRVFANGGGGGGGAAVPSTDGGNGSDPITADTPAGGGIATTLDGSNGGAGAFKSTPAASANPATHGGGGGGGGVGVIRILSGQTVAPINVSPTPIVN